MRYVALAALVGLWIPSMAAQAPGAAGTGTAQTTGRGGSPILTGSGPTASIRGRVIAADTNRPVRSARLEVSAAELSISRAFITDVNGRFEIKGLAAGRYTIIGSAPGFVTLSYGQTRPFEVGKPIALGEGQLLDNVTLTLPRSGAIAGIVLDERGRPLIGASVMAARPQFVRGVQQLTALATSMTNDLGEFRISGLAPGAFFVSAKKVIGLSSDSESGYARTFFPGSRSITEARLVTVRLGQTTAGITLALDARGSGAIVGKVVEEDGRPLPTLLVRVRRTDGLEEYSGLGGTVTQVGTFETVALSPGEYELIVAPLALAAGRGASPGDAAPRIAVSKVVLSGEIATDVRLVMKPMSAVAGRFVLDPSAKGSVPISGIKVGMLPVNPSEFWWYSTTVAPAEDLSFALHAPAGRMLLRPTLPKGWALKAVRVKGEDVTDAGIDIRAGEDLRDVEVELTDRVPTVSGSVRNAKGDRISNYTVLFFSRDRARWQGDGRYIAAVRPDQAGLFSIDSLVPGEYYVAALDYLDPGEAQNPVLLERLQPDAIAVVLREGDTAALDLRVMP